jgi:hypothetical protein
VNLINSFLGALAILQMTTACSKATSHHSSDSQPVAGQEQIVRGKIFSARIVNWERGPEVSGDTLNDINNACVIEVTRADGQTPTSLTVLDVFPYMKVHGHGAPDEQITTAVEGSRIRVEIPLRVP